ncbi:hypothetical protein GRF29_1g2405877 [Pseudopithomyces chartarum]|uniref:t-SNARE coiled-coil homology domain-containing protein n=1 Tax=Pseudopithomyces chartarum TaxID=1892770 RepID=A0AAN6M8I4_9PLEO|nr:hypothetical protein GRF29_1g2405877 [Pseudopithomyces chartarum]
MGEQQRLRLRLRLRLQLQLQLQLQQRPQQQPRYHGTTVDLLEEATSPPPLPSQPHTHTPNPAVLAVLAGGTMAVSIQDRTDEFRSILAQAQRKQAQSKTGAQRQSLLTAQQKAEATTQHKYSEFQRSARDVARGISSTMAKLERLAQLARRKTLFDDRPVEIDELTFVIKQDMAQLSRQIQDLQALTSKQHPKAKPGADQQGEHNHQVVVMLKDKLQNVGGSFKDVLERGRSPGGFRNTNAAQQDLLSLDPSGSSALGRGGAQSDAQLMLMEEAQAPNQYIQQRGHAIESIESTISELGSIFGQLAQMVSEQGEQIQRIDANTEDVVDNVEGAQRELMKYWNRVQGNRWLVAKMFGVLMIFFLLWVLIAG